MKLATLSPMGKKEETETVRLRKSLVRRIARIAAHRDLSVPDYLALAVTAVIDQDEAAMLDDLKRERGDAGPPPKKPRA